MELLGFTVLGLAVLLHVTFASITLGTGIITALYRYLAYSQENSYYETFAKKAFRIMVVFELVSGVWGTIVTVFLAGIFPNLTALATNILFVPIIIAVISIMVRIPSIPIFWYTWNRISAKKHVMLGFVMAISGFGVPFGFRTIFAEITHPFALQTFLNYGSAPLLQSFANQLYLILYIHTVAAVISIGGFAVMSLMSYDRDVRGAMIGWKFGYPFLLLQLVFGAVYWASLSTDSSYIFNSITTGIFLPVFVTKLFLVLILLFAGYPTYVELKNGIIPRFALIAGFIAIITAFLGELINDASRYPYMVITGKSGFPISAFFNYYMQMPIAVIYLILGFIIASLGIFAVALFYALLKRFVELPS